MMKKLPIGIQEFSEFGKDYLYIDKTEHIFKLLQGKYYFLSRPRRFGKSLLLNTIKEIFKGRKELFEGLWIYDKIEWEEYPVIKISFSNIAVNEKGLTNAIYDELRSIAQSYGLELTEKHPGAAFKELIIKLSIEKKIVILIDEYDKPIIDYIDDIPQADENRKILKSFYSVIKDSDDYIKFFFVTGVSKFSQVSIFSDLNNLNDITLDENYSTITGYTQQELELSFDEFIESTAEKYKNIFPDIIAEIKKWYNGYSWDGVNFVYNPFSILNFFYKRAFGDYWFATGTPTFLTKLIKQKDYTVFDLENRIVSKNALNKYEITSISLVPLLFQTGYLTIKESNLRDMTYRMDFPNAEVESSFTIYLLASLNDGHIDKTDSLLNDMKFALRENNIEKFIELVNILFKGISYLIADNKEKYFHSVFYLIVKLLGFTIETEVMTIDGRIDTVITTEKYIYVIEFKAGQDAKTAMQQIKDKEYHKKFITEKKPITLIGINFDIDNKTIDEYLIEKL
ncbi:MAG: hypothetical protein B6D61_01745 [Bacteroidetes bacterium 4484_249]|nr:MAG: hypothetical protein B6D61_01745 [Bacteroidetes bacterium 4484_249]